ncbi:MAG: aminotransferase class V-fold PLP-dependent enzyme [Gammaproteobacteria bacterium]
MSNNFPVEKIRQDFPGLHQQVNGHPLVYFDNAATTQKPQAVIEAINQHYKTSNANVHRAIHTLSDRATQAFEQSRTNITRFINAEHEHEVIFTKGTTEGINLVAQSYAIPFLKKGDEILITTMEHHANIVPWQVVCERNGCELQVVPLTGSGEIDREAFTRLLSERTKLVAFPHISNVLGTINPVADMIAEIRQLTPAAILIDGAQAVAHLPIDVQALDCDFYLFSGHKLYAPCGIGILYGKSTLLEQMIPYQTGGEMIRTVTFAFTEYNDLPFKFEAGTPNIEGVIGLNAAIKYLLQIGLDNIGYYEQQLREYITSQILQNTDVQIIGTAANKSPIVTFIAEGAPPHDISTLLDLSGVAIRVGHHCTMPLHQALGIAASARASLAMYNTREEIDIFIQALQKTLKVLRGK